VLVHLLVDVIAVASTLDLDLDRLGRGFPAVEAVHCYPTMMHYEEVVDTERKVLAAVEMLGNRRHMKAAATMLGSSPHADERGRFEAIA
jgi:hypothetical protein